MTDIISEDVLLFKDKDGGYFVLGTNRTKESDRTTTFKKRSPRARRRGGLNIAFITTQRVNEVTPLVNQELYTNYLYTLISIAGIPPNEVDVFSTLQFGDRNTVPNAHFRGDLANETTVIRVQFDNQSDPIELLRINSLDAYLVSIEFDNSFIYCSIKYGRIADSTTNPISGLNATAIDIDTREDSFGTNNPSPQFIFGYAKLKYFRFSRFTGRVEQELNFDFPQKITISDDWSDANYHKIWRSEPITNISASFIAGAFNSFISDVFFEENYGDLQDQTPQSLRIATCPFETNNLEIFSLHRDRVRSFYSTIRDFVEDYRLNVKGDTDSGIYPLTNPGGSAAFTSSDSTYTLSQSNTFPRFSNSRCSQRSQEINKFDFTFIEYVTDVQSRTFLFSRLNTRMEELIEDVPEFVPDPNPTRDTITQIILTKYNSRINLDDLESQLAVYTFDEDRYKLTAYAGVDDFPNLVFLPGDIVQEITINVQNSFDEEGLFVININNTEFILEDLANGINYYRFACFVDSDSRFS